MIKKAERGAGHALSEIARAAADQSGAQAGDATAVSRSGATTGAQPLAGSPPPLGPEAIPAQVSQLTEGPSGPVDTASLSRKPSSMVELRRPDAVRPSRLVTGWNFDWDDNIFFMPTEIMLHNKVTGEERGVATHEFALMREEIGEPGPWKDYETRDDAYRYFREGAPGPDGEPGENHFVRDVERAMQGAPERWQGPSWDAFVKACRRKETAENTTIITARGHAPREMYAGLELLQSLGYIKHLPRVENLFPVTYPPLNARLGGGSAASPSSAKVEAMKQVLDDIQASDFPPDAIEVVDRAGEEKRVMHLWGFSDDDYGNYSKAVEALSAEIARGRWPDVKISVFFTGKNNPDEAPRGEILTPDGGARPLRSDELAISNASWREE